MTSGSSMSATTSYIATETLPLDRPQLKIIDVSVISDASGASGAVGGPSPLGWAVTCNQPRITWFPAIAAMSRPLRSGCSRKPLSRSRNALTFGRSSWPSCAVRITPCRGQYGAAPAVEVGDRNPPQRGRRNAARCAVTPPCDQRPTHDRAG